MRKFSINILFLTLLLALTTINLFAQGNSDFGRSRAEEMAASDLPQGKHIGTTKNREWDLNPYFSTPGFALTTGGTSAATSIIDHGGPVMSQVKIYIIFYGNWGQSNGTDNAAGKQIILDWANTIGASPHYALNSSYMRGGTFYSPTFGGSVTLPSTGYSTSLTDAQIQQQVLAAVPSFNNGVKDPNGVYFLVTSSDVTASSGFCTQYCGWHTHVNNASSGNVDIKYSFVGNAARCLSGCAAQSTSPNGNAGVDGSISVLTHELEETHSDPDLNAWYDRRGAENADKCAWTFGHFQYQVNGAWANMHLGGTGPGNRDYLIQRNLLNGASDFCMVDSTHN